MNSFGNLRLLFAVLILLSLVRVIAHAQPSEVLIKGNGLNNLSKILIETGPNVSDPSSSLKITIILLNGSRCEMFARSLTDALALKKSIGEANKVTAHGDQFRFGACSLVIEN